MSGAVEDAPMAGEHRTVRRVMTLLEVVIAREPEGVRLGDLADAVQAPKSSVHGLAKGLVAMGYLREQDNRYFIGAATAHLLGRDGIGTAVTHRALEDLRDTVNETTVLGSLVGDALLNIDIVESNQELRHTPPLNVRRPLLPSSMGKCFLAFMSAKQRTTCLRRLINDPEERVQMEEELSEVRETRIAVNRDATLVGVTSVASPIIVAGSPVTHAIAATGPSNRMRDHVEDIAKVVLETALLLSR